jgi:hypothetical protein
MQSSSEICPKCSGYGYNAKAFAAQSAGVVNTIARLNPEDKNYTKQLDDAGRRLWLMAEKYPKAFMELNLAEGWAAAGKKNPRGLPLMLVGKYETTFDADGDDPLHVVRCQGTLYVLNKNVMIHATKGDMVVFGGLLAGGLWMDDGTFVPVLQYGFLVSDDAKQSGAKN